MRPSMPIRVVAGADLCLRSDRDGKVKAYVLRKHCGHALAVVNIARNLVNEYKDEAAHHSVKLDRLYYWI